MLEGAEFSRAVCRESLSQVGAHGGHLLGKAGDKAHSGNEVEDISSFFPSMLVPGSSSSQDARSLAFYL